MKLLLSLLLMSAGVLSPALAQLPPVVSPEQKEQNQVMGDFDLNGLLPVFVECTLRTTTKATCNDFIRGLFSQNEKITRAPAPGKAIVTLILTDEPVDSQNIRYTFSWKMIPQANISDFPTTATINNSASDSVSVLNSLIKNADDTVKFLAEFIREHGESSNSEPEQPQTRFEKLGKSPLYITLGMNGSYNSRGTAPYDTKSNSLDTWGSAAWLKDKYKFKVGAYYETNNAKVPTDTGYLTSKTKYFGVDGIAVYSMSKRWSVAVINSESIDRNSNIDLNSKTSAGLEWTLVPFRTVENQEVAFRVGASNNILDLDQPNALGNTYERYLSAFAKIYFYWVLKGGQVTLKANAGVEQNLQRKGFETYNAGGSVQFQVSKSVQLSMNGSYNYVARSLTYPSSPDLSNPLLVQQLNGQAGRKIVLSVGLNYTIGNSIRKTRDRRWADF